MSKHHHGAGAARDHQEKSYLARDTWMRGVFMLLFAVAWSIAEVVLFAVVLFQFASVLFTRAPNERLQAFGRQIAAYVFAITLFFTYNSEDRPWPFAAWPANSGSLPAKPRGASA